jgi:pimeloyl-ACP methyl ester carboxylesterase
VLPALAETRRVIGIEQQGHGHTKDVDRPLDPARMGTETAAVLRHLGIEKADVFGFSSGGDVAFELTLHHPELVRKLVLAGGTSFSYEGLYPEVVGGIQHVTPEMMVGSPYAEGYAATAPDPDAWPALIEKVKELDRTFENKTPDDVRRIAGTPALLIIGDADIVRPEHTVEMFRLLGGGVPGDLVGVPPTHLAVLPGTTHTGLMARGNYLVEIVNEFLDAD